MDTLENSSIPSESNSHIVYSHQQIWDKQEITLALSKLPAGEIAQALIPTLSGEKLYKVIRNIECSNYDRLESAELFIVVPQSING